MEERREKEEKLLKEFEKYGETLLDGLMDRVRKVTGEDPILTEKVLKAVLRGVRKSKRAMYERERVHGVYSLPPRFRPYFEAAREYAFSKNWIKKNTDAAFANFCIRVTVENIIRRLRQEDAEFARMAKESEQLAEGNDKSREGEKDNQR